MSDLTIKEAQKIPLSFLGCLVGDLLTHSATSPIAYHWGLRAVPPKAGKGLSLSVSTLRKIKI